ncbi:MAG: glycosyltransferase family 2 protein [Rhabdochlamydiaceae bacterium]|nr:glycosyltransferase family 2 protein [Candidatus Amphrikana amoebophyrae]
MISITILTKNCSNTLAKSLDSVKEFEEVIILDNGSTDNSLEIAALYPNVKIHHSPFIGFGPLHNLASSLASHDWIFALDSDEVVTEELKEALFALKLDPLKGYEVLRKNYFNGKWIKGCGWYPDNKVRLFHRKQAQFTPVQVHESVDTTNIKIIKLNCAILHYSYLSISDLLRKMDHYSSLYAKENKDKKRSSFTKALFASLFTFFKSYILKLGIRDGKEGFVISLYNSQTTFYKHLKLCVLHNSRFF